MLFNREMNKIYYLIIICSVLQFGCGDTNKKKTSEKEDEETEDNSWKLEDGDYCADVIYYNPSTGYKASYDLTVEVVNNTPTKIYFCNGGNIHDFSASELDENHACSFTANDGKEYTVNLSEELCSETKRCSDEESAVYPYDYVIQVLGLSNREIQELEKNLEFTKGDFITGTRLDILREYLKSYRALNSINSMIANGNIVEISILPWRGSIRCQVMIVKKHNMYYLFEIMGQSEAIMGTLEFDENDTNWQGVIVKHDPEGKEIMYYNIRLLESDGNMGYLRQRMNVYCHY